jgi:hypothetical protein
MTNELFAKPGGMSAMQMQETKCLEGKIPCWRKLQVLGVFFL